MKAWATNSEIKAGGNCQGRRRGEAEARPAWSMALPGGPGFEWMHMAVPEKRLGVAEQCIMSFCGRLVAKEGMFLLPTPMFELNSGVGNSLRHSAIAA